MMSRWRRKSMFSPRFASTFYVESKFDVPVSKWAVIIDYSILLKIYKLMRLFQIRNQKIAIIRMCETF